MSKTIDDKIEQIFNKVELLKTNENTALMVEVWELMKNLKHTINDEEAQRKTNLQQKLDEISRLI